MPDTRPSIPGFRSSVLSTVNIQTERHFGFVPEGGAFTGGRPGVARINPDRTVRLHNRPRLLNGAGVYRNHSSDESDMGTIRGS